MVKRAERRHHKFRKIRQAKRIMKHWYPVNERSKKSMQEWVEEYAKRTADHLKNCSCYMCGNPRKYYKEKTIQEVKADISTNEQLDEFQR